MPAGTEIAKAYVQIIPSAQGIKGNIEKELSGELESAGNSGGQLLGSKLVGALKAAIAAAGIGKILQSAMSEGAKLQQSYGGLETIYGEAADQAKIFAEQAYAAGISANDYAEQAVSFGASLKQAFGGDTQAAVEAANTAIMDMTDNAAKMGTPIENIQTAYQGFAKQNYTMLDNLKLGYGGTKTEMERLLADASKLSGVKYDISNLGDVYQAIHVIQGELGLTGVAAAEAEGTFSGSMGAMQASLANFLGALATGQDIEPSLMAVIGNVGTFIQNNLFPMLTNIISAVPSILQTAIPMLITSLQTMLQELLNTLQQGGMDGGLQTVMKIVEGLLKGLPQIITTGGEIVTNLVSAIGKQAPKVISEAGRLITDFVGSILKELPNILNTGAQVVTKLSEGLVQAIPTVVAAAGKAIADFLSTVLSNLPSIVDSGINLLTKFAEGMNNNTQALIYAVANAIKQIVSTIVQHLPEIVESGVKIIAFLITGLARQVPHVLTTIAALITDIINSFTRTDWGEIGSRILEGLANGLRAGVGMVVDAAKNAARSAFEAAKDFLGIESPSKLFRDEVGEMMAKGMAIGFEDNVPTAEIQSSLKPMANVVPETLGSSQYSYGGFTVNVYGAPGQDVSALADIIEDRINGRIRRQEAAFA